MRVLFERTGFAGSAVGDVIRSMDPGSEVVDGKGEQFRRQVPTADIVGLSGKWSPPTYSR